MKAREDVHARWFRRLLRLYPPAFRDVYGAEMTEYFLARLRRAREGGGRRAVLRLWLGSGSDVMRTALHERRHERQHRRAARGAGMVAMLQQEIRYAARRLLRSPVFAMSSILILAVGLGLNAAVFSLVDAILLRPAPFGEADRLVHIYQDSDEGAPTAAAYPAYRDIAATPGLFRSVAAAAPASAIWESGTGSLPVAVEYATSSLFDVLGLQPSRGRWFSPDHDHVGGEMAAVLTHHAWRTRFGGSSDVIGSVVRLNGYPVTIIGVGPASYNGEAGALLSDFWLSISSTPVGGPYQVANLERREDHWYLVKARLADGVTVQQAQSAMDALALRQGEEFPDVDAGRAITVFAHDRVRLHPEVDGSLVPAGVGLLTLAGLILLLATSNLANLLLVRGLGRRSETAVRLALGAGRAAVVRLQLLEALLLAAVGAAAGLALAAWTLRLLPALPLPIPSAGLDVRLDVRVAVFGAALGILTALLVGLLPALRTTRLDPSSAMRDEARGGTAGPRTQLLHATLVAVQVAASVVLVVSAGLLARSLANAAGADPGVDVDRIAVLGTTLQHGSVADGEADVLAAELLDRVQRIPGVETAALTTRLPVQGGSTTTQVVDGYEPQVGTGAVELPFAMVSRDYFVTMGLRVLDGRAFTDEDRRGSRRVVVVNETAARLYWNGGAVGGRLRPQGASDGWREVVGVVQDAGVNSLTEAPTPMIFYAIEQTGAGTFSIVARTSGAPAALLPQLRSALRDVRSTLPVTREATLADMVHESLAGTRLATTLLGTFSALALLLATLGVYAIVAFNVQRRSQELGIRAALGAARSRLVGTVVGHSVSAVLAGLVVGLWLASLTVRAMEGLLFGVRPLDPLTYSGAALLLLVVATVAALLPALRAARTDPLDVMQGRRA
jgi:predicted permease